MFKNLKERMKNKKGFTLVELIVVIVIILVLAAVMVPSVLRYVEKANQANCKADAATLLVELQAEVADYYAEGTVAAFPAPTIGGIAGVGTYDEDVAPTGTAKAAFTYTLDTTSTSKTLGDITQFSYGTARYYINWTLTGGWSAVTKR